MTALAEAPAPALEDVCRPAYVHVPERAGSHLRAVEGVAAKIGRTLDPTQRLAVDVITSAKADGSPATLSAALVVPRQNLKTYCLELVTLTRLLRPGGDKLAVWSAHEVSTATETFTAFAELAEAEDSRGRPLYPWFAERVVSISRATGRESITFVRRGPGGRKEKARLKFKARVKTGGRGLAGDLVILDEAFALEPAHMGSLLPILSTKAKGQIIYGSSAPLATSLVLHDVIRRGRAGLMAYAEWRAPGSWAEPGCRDERCGHRPGTPGCVLDDLELAVGCNPAAWHGRISRGYLASERLELAAIPEEYARERLGWGEDPAASGREITEDAWSACADPESRPLPSPVVLAVDTTKGLRSAVVVACGWRADGRAHGELLRMEAGTEWLGPYLTEKQAALGCKVMMLGGSSTAQALIPHLESGQTRVRLTEVGPSDYAAACVAFAAEVTGDRWRHLGDPLAAAAVKGAGTRDVGDAGAWRWSPKDSSADITPLVALTIARWELSRHVSYDVSASVG